MMMRLYFAYGSNMDSAQMEVRCPTAQLLGPAVLAQSAFFINANGVASVRPDAAKRVHGLVWRLEAEDERALDRYEGVSHRLYEKRVVPVTFRGESLQALIYVASETSPGVPRAGYLEQVVTAMKASAFPEEYLEEVAEWLLTSS